MGFFLVLALLPGLVTFGTDLLIPVLISSIIWLVVLGITAVLGGIRQRFRVKYR